MNTIVEVWTHWGLNPGPSACGADVIPLRHVPNCEPHMVMFLLTTHLDRANAINRKSVAARGLEPLTLRLLAVRPNQQSYETNQVTASATKLPEFIDSDVH